jgi:hypothetical protein
MDRDYLAGFPHSPVQRVVRGIKIFRGARESEVRERLPITPDLLLHIFARLTTDTQKGVTYHATFCTAFAGFLRVGGLTWDPADWLSAVAGFSIWDVTRRSV